MVRNHGKCEDPARRKALGQMHLHPLSLCFYLLCRMSQEWTKSREEGWDNTKDTRIKEYNALFDPNMRHFFETPSVQGHLLRTGQV